MVTCEVPACEASFFYVGSRRWPYRCLEHSDELARLVDGWTPDNSVD